MNKATTEYWLFADGRVKQMARTATHFTDLITGANYTLAEFWQYAQASQGHAITPEAYKRICEGSRTYLWDTE